MKSTKRKGKTGREAMVDAAEAVLREAGGPLKVSEIWEKIKARGYRTSGLTPPMSLSAILQRASSNITKISQRSKTSRFVKVGSGTFDLIGRTKATAVMPSALARTHRNAEADVTEEYFVRLCWNSARWAHPTGEAAKLENGTFANKSGFGFEEWLFDFSRSIEGYQYGFLQPIASSFPRVSGSVLSAELYTISPDHQRLSVGKIRRLEVLSRSEAEATKKRFRKNGWLQLMSRQVWVVGGNADDLDGKPGEEMFNIRFKTEDAQIKNRLEPFPDRHPICSLRRYRLYSKRQFSQGEAGEPGVTRTKSRQGTWRLKSTNSWLTQPSPGKEIDPFHNRMQNELFQLLTKRFGEQSVVMEENFVDIKVTRPDRTILLEIKTDPTPRNAIRQALGQLMDYALFDREQLPSKLELVIVAPNKIKREEELYLQRLMKNFNIPISYRNFEPGEKTFDLPA